MSRIGKLPISIPTGVTVTLKDNVVTVKGPKGALSQFVDPSILSLIHIYANRHFITQLKVSDIFT